VELYAELKLAIDLLQVDHKARDVYARVVKVFRRGDAFLAGLEFTSLSPSSNERIQMFVHHALQGEERR
jgi:adenylate cyclase